MSDTRAPECAGQLDLLGGVPYVPENGTETSAIAARTVKPSAAKMRQSVLEAIRHLWPCTDEAVAEHLGWDGNSVRPRRIDLVRRGEVIADGRGLTRKGNPATTWRPAEGPSSCINEIQQVPRVPGTGRS